MNLILIQYPIILSLFILSFISILLTYIIRKCSRLASVLLAILALLSISGMFFSGFYYALPLWELLGLMLILLLLCSILFMPKGGNP